MAIEQVQVVPAVASGLLCGQPFFEGLSRHDRVFVNDPLLYFLVGRPSVTRHHEMYPGVVTEAAVQAQIIAELEAQQPELIVLFSMFEDVQEPNDSGRSSGIFVLDRYIQSRYTLDRSFGPNYHLMRLER
ncbi:MAG: ChaN family lipoprotein [Chloroflexi bacterium]|nr:ChaN family lipoprotein [Chloroflexota bacterium]